MSHDRDRDRRPGPIAGAPESGRSDEYRQPFRPDEWDQAPPTPYRPQGRPRPESRRTASLSRDRGYRWLRDDEERFAEGPPMPESGGNARRAGYGEENYREAWTPQGRHTVGSPLDAGWSSRGPYAGREPKGYRRCDERMPGVGRARRWPGRGPGTGCVGGHRGQVPRKAR